MKTKIIFSALIFLLPLISSFSQVHVAYIEGDIDLGLAPYVKRVIDDAEEQMADAVIFRINTFGGRVDAATQIKDAILNSDVLTIAFIDKRAISAGALISLSCNKIVMVPGASIGASTVVDGQGKKVPEKYQSYMRSEMRATAEKNGRRTDIAEGMVDERVVVEGLVDSTQLITLTTTEAMKYGIADTTLNSINEALAFFNLEKADIVKNNENWAESVVRFLSHPIISSLLMMIGMIGMFTEIKSPGWGLPGTAAVIALALFFGAHYILELASVIEIILFVAGAILLILEIFVIPGFGIFGIGGILLMFAGLFLGLLSDFRFIDFDMISAVIIQMALTLIVTLIVIYFLLKFLPKTNMWNKLILADNVNSTSGYSSYSPDFPTMVGHTGKALTDLRPAGTAIIDGKRVDVVTDGEFITRNTPVKVTKVSGSKIVVEETK